MHWHVARTLAGTWLPTVDLYTRLPMHRIVAATALCSVHALVLVIRESVRNADIFIIRYRHARVLLLRFVTIH